MYLKIKVFSMIFQTFTMLSSSYPILYIYGFWVVFKQPINNICMAMINRFMQQSVPILILRYSLNEIVNVAQFLFIRYECLVISFNQI